jgi:hypothetical protein
MTGLQLEFADSHALFREQVDPSRPEQPTLPTPACQHAVDLFTGYVFGAKGHAFFLKLTMSVKTLCKHEITGNGLKRQG